MSHILFIMAENALFDMEAFEKKSAKGFQERYTEILELIDSKFPLNVSPDIRLNYQESYLGGLSGQLVGGRRMNSLAMLCWDYASLLEHSDQRNIEKNLTKDPYYRIKNQYDHLRKAYDNHDPLITKAGYKFGKYTQLKLHDLVDQFRDSARHTPDFIEGYAHFNLMTLAKHDVKLVILTEGKVDAIRTYFKDRCYGDDQIPHIEHIGHERGGKIDEQQLGRLCHDYASRYQVNGECQIFVGSDFKRHIKPAEKNGLVPVYMTKEKHVAQESDLNYDGYQIESYTWNRVNKMAKVLEEVLEPIAAAQACQKQWTNFPKEYTNPFQQNLI